MYFLLLFSDIKMNTTDDGHLQYEIDYGFEGPNITFKCSLGYTLSPDTTPRVYDQNALENLVLPDCRSMLR